jgi:hypothetical protein
MFRHCPDAKWRSVGYRAFVRLSQRCCYLNITSFRRKQKVLHTNISCLIKHASLSVIFITSFPRGYLQRVPILQLDILRSCKQSSRTFIYSGIWLRTMLAATSNRSALRRNVNGKYYVPIQHFSVVVLQIQNFTLPVNTIL